MDKNVKVIYNNLDTANNKAITEKIDKTLDLFDKELSKKKHKNKGAR